MKRIFLFALLMGAFAVEAQVRVSDQVNYSLNLVQYGMTGSLSEIVKSVDYVGGRALVSRYQVMGNDVQASDEWRPLKDFLTSDEIDYVLSNCASQYQGVVEIYNVQGRLFPSCHLKNLQKHLPQMAQALGLDGASDAWLGHVPITGLFEVHYLSDYGPLIMKITGLHFGQ